MKWLMNEEKLLFAPTFQCTYQSYQKFETLFMLFYVKQKKNHNNDNNNEWSIKSEIIYNKVLYL
jgi:hypothetical protein